nr:SDR family oxidoreductase [Bradyrhizobium hipponense]
MCRAALPLLKQQGGAIVNVATVAAFNASPDSTSYAASKAAVVAYTRSLAYAHGADSIRANAVAPGWVRTPMSAYEMQLLAEQNDTTADAEFRSVERRIALGRMAAPAEIAACCLFLASDACWLSRGALYHRPLWVSWWGELGQEEFLDLGPRVAAARPGRSSSHGFEAGARKASQNTWIAIDTNWSSLIAEDRSQSR